MSTEFDKANEIAKAHVDRVMAYAHFEGLAPAGIAQAAFRMGYMEAMAREQEAAKTAKILALGNEAHRQALVALDTVEAMQRITLTSDPNAIYAGKPDIWVDPDAEIIAELDKEYGVDAE